MAVAGMRRTQRNPDRFVPHDICFHETIGKATGNPLFALLAGPLRECLGVSIRAGLESRTTQAQLSRVVDTHAAIVDAIEAQLAMKAADLMIVHFEEAKDALRGTSRRAVRR
jgi:GntR family transcriptional regulator, transcriptional repressor for pyruvate dehydrogenase complex